MKKRALKKRILISLGLAIISLLLFGTIVLAAPSDITYFTASPSNTSIYLHWNKATSSTTTLVRYSKTTYPTTTGGADGTTIYSSSLNSYEHTGLSEGTTYYYSAWGYDGANYSTNAYHTVATTKGTYAEGDDFPPQPTLPSNMNQAPVSSTWYNNLQPFTGIISDFANTFGMPRNNALVLASVIGMVGAGVWIYISTKNFFIAYGAVFALDLLAVGMHLIFGWSIFVLIAMGLGVWAVERYYQ